MDHHGRGRLGERARGEHRPATGCADVVRRSEGLGHETQSTLLRTASAVPYLVEWVCETTCAATTWLRAVQVEPSLGCQTFAAGRLWPGFCSPGEDGGMSESRGGGHRPGVVRRAGRGRAGRCAGGARRRRGRRDRSARGRSSRSWPRRRPRRTASRPGFGALATRHIPTEMRAQLQRSLVRSHAAGLRPRGRARGGPRADAAAALDARDRAHRDPARDRAAARRPAQPTGSRRSCASTARSAAPATSPRCRTARSR